MNQNQQAGQPQATFIPSDFNDLHLMFGLEEVKAQIVQAINTSIPLSPEPPKTNKSIHIEGQIEKVSHVPVVEENLMAVESGQGVTFRQKMMLYLNLFRNSLIVIT